MSAPLELIRCQNPRCPSLAHGEPRLLARARLVPGAAFEPAKCRTCGMLTSLTVLPDGQLDIRVRWPKRPVSVR